MAGKPLNDDAHPAADGGRMSFDRVLDHLFRGLAYISSMVLALLMLVTVVDVGLRWFAVPLFNSVELTEILLVVLVMLALPQCAASGGHVRVDVFDRALGRWGRFAGDLLTAAISVTILGFLCYRTGLKAMDSYRYGDATNMLRMPIWPLYVMVVVGMGGYGLAVLRDLWRLLRPVGK